MNFRFFAFLLCVAGTLYGQPTGGRGDGIWLRNAYYGETQTFDSCVGHQPGSGQYHHHANPVCLRAQLGDNLELIQASRNGSAYREKTSGWKHSPILGWAYDGYPIYGPYSYADPQNATSTVRRMKSSFRLRSITARTSLPDWALVNHAGIPQQLPSNQYGPAITVEFPLGRYIEDFEYVSGLGDLDAQNGRFGITPEFPNGTYAYFVTVDDAGTPAFPYIFGLQYQGVASGGAARTIGADAVDYFANGALVGTASTAPILSAWATRNSLQAATVVSGYNPAGGPQTTWPTDIPAGVTAPAGVTSPTLADAQRIRASSTTVYLNANGLASYAMGPWFDPLQPGGIFGNFPTNQNAQIQLPRTPAAATSKSLIGLGPVGVWVNGVAVFDFLDGASYSNATASDAGGGLVSPSAILASSASFERAPTSPGAFLTAVPIFGSVLSDTIEAATSTNLPQTLGGTTISVRDSAGVTRPATLSYASPTQVNFRLPTTLTSGFGTVSISARGKTVSAGIYVAVTYPHAFIKTAGGFALGYLQRIRDGVSTYESLTVGADGLTGTPIDLGTEKDAVYATLFLSGIADSPSVKATVGGVATDVVYAGPQGEYPGLSQVNILLPRAVAGKGKVDIVLRVDGKMANAVNVTVR
jgi:uncharacterized protein (TIGR03437 family)